MTYVETIRKAQQEFRASVAGYMIANPDKPYGDIAKEKGTSKVTVANIATEFGIRRYKGRKPKAQVVIHE